MDVEKQNAQIKLLETVLPNDTTGHNFVCSPPSVHGNKLDSPESNDSMLGNSNVQERINLTAATLLFGPIGEQEIVVSRDTLARIEAYAACLVDSASQYLDGVGSLYPISS